MSEELTPEERRQLEQQMADIEFEMEVAREMPPWLREYVSAQKAKMFPIKEGYRLGGPNSEIQGFYIPKGLEESRRYGNVFKQAGLGSVADWQDTAWATGPHNANPPTWAHEFAHRAYSEQDASFWGGEERQVLLGQAYMADSPEDWDRILRLWKDYRIMRGGKFASDEEAEEDLILNSQSFIHKERKWRQKKEEELLSEATTMEKLKYWLRKAELTLTPFPSSRFSTPGRQWKKRQEKIHR